MKPTTAVLALLAQTALCEKALQAREAKVTAVAALPAAGRRAQKDACSEGKTACGDGNGCCPRGSKCTQSQGVGVCADACEGATVFCDFGKALKLCCQPGASCDYAQSVCTQHRTDSGGVWTPLSSSLASADGTPLPTAPVFDSTEGGEAGGSSHTETAASTGGLSSSSSSGAEEETQTGTSSSEAAGPSASPATEASGTNSGGGGATATKTPKDSGSAVVVSWSGCVLATVFGIMAAL
ncbi:hypothetical protein V2A60_008064 [Cordyceps javanica]|uniref:GPI anchored serine-threonine rich protein n=1 Tax=Cordyceps javanica TaxID=43265 RepID=A0A545UNT6_9HYPO|nr:hypothetical protein IF1G_10363 [Cordyceps javanica]